MDITYKDLSKLQNNLKGVPQWLLDIKNPLSPSNHYEFLYLLVNKFKPKIIVELGTHWGIASLFMYYGNPESELYTVDIIRYELSLIENLPIIKFLGDSRQLYKTLPNDIDLCFLDTSHDYELTKNEYELYLPKMKKGGVMLFDDVLTSKGVNIWWNEVEHQKLLLDKIHLGYGFGVIIV